MDRIHNIDTTTRALFDYCEKHNWAGYDPYDALNSRIFARTPFYKSKLIRIAVTQALKRLPFNIRPLLMITREANPKALALFLMAGLKLVKSGVVDRKDLPATLIQKLIALRSPNTDYWCWGYSFPWQGRTVLVPKGEPNLVCTNFVANALLDAYDATGEPHCLSMAMSAAHYMLNELCWSEGGVIAGFSYPLPSVKARVHNANLLGAALFCRIHRQGGEKKFLDTGLRIARYSAGCQREDGSWYYGEWTTQHWIDNFHTGYNLCALRDIGKYAETTEFEPHLRRGYNFYKRHFFTKNNAAKYFHDRTYPLDIHSVAQSIITLVEMKELDPGSIDLASAVYAWAKRHMWNEKGYFYYQIYPFFKNRISYMRWSEAWMLLALATLLEGYAGETESIKADNH